MSEKIRRFTDLVVWQEAHQLVLFVYTHTKSFPVEERFGLTNQIRRAVISITSNIAEGFGRKSAKDKQHFYIMAKTSLSELESQFITAKDLKYTSTQTLDVFYERIIRVERLLSGLLKSASNFTF